MPTPEEIRMRRKVVPEEIVRTFEFTIRLTGKGIGSHVAWKELLSRFRDIKDLEDHYGNAGIKDITEKYFVTRSIQASAYGGPEEGGWHYSTSDPVGPFEVFYDHDKAIARMQELNERDECPKPTGLPVGGCDNSYGATEPIGQEHGHEERWCIHTGKMCDTKPAYEPAQRPHYE